MNLSHSFYYLKNGLKNFLRSGHPVLVLTYHRISNCEFDPFQLNVSPEIFESHLVFFKKHFAIIGLDQIKEKNKKRSIAITFDDGYFDNFSTALPILEKHQVPITIFISTGFIRGAFYYWDIVTEFINQGFDSKVLESLFPDIDNLSDKKLLCFEICHKMKWMDLEKRNKLADLLLSMISDVSFLEKHRIVKYEELLKYSKHPLVSIGAHTVNHLPLSSLSIENQEKEISTSLEVLEKIVGSKISFFAYPYGGQKDFNRDSEVLMKNLKQTSFTNSPGFYISQSKDFSIPRICILNHSLKLLTWNLFKTYFRS